MCNTYIFQNYKNFTISYTGAFNYLCFLMFNHNNPVLNTYIYVIFINSFMIWIVLKRTPWIMFYAFYWTNGKSYIYDIVTLLRHIFWHTVWLCVCICEINLVLLWSNQLAAKKFIAKVVIYIRTSNRQLSLKSRSDKWSYSSVILKYPQRVYWS